MSDLVATLLALLECLLLIAGTLLMLLGTAGLLRMPDVYNRMQAAAKTSTLGFAFIALATIPAFASLDVTIRVLLAVAFLYLTAPIAAHTIARAARRTGVALWEGSVRDEMERPGESEGTEAPRHPGIQG